ncbi:GntR family transcriptional regulator [Maritalea mediterranea]|uniref:GntR family transcriptional regulator n=1 Tax=Maritalea mediterranea TaxID=2909667 RepID=A0ABS9E822_9HYPH|nr:GntR family transcriptional regulator [Maritalea mediterranea]
MSESSVESVVQMITDAVRTGRLAPGMRLVEAEFTQNLGVSRSTVREGFQRLIAAGLLVSERHRGVSVRQFTRKQVNDLYVLRATLEALGVQLATPHVHAAPAYVEELQRKMDAAEAERDLTEFSQLNTAFHHHLADLADNEYLKNVILQFETSIYWLQFRVLVDQQSVFRTNQDHRDIVKHMVAGQALEAAAAMRQHILNAGEMVQALPSNHFKREMVPQS